jgi:hypothetical protein
MAPVHFIDTHLKSRKNHPKNVGKNTFLTDNNIFLVLLILVFTIMQPRSESSAS